MSALNTFVQAAELRNFTSAGRRLGVSASAVGKAVARLEERLGVRLFHRSTRSVTLTAEGEAFLSRCRKIFSEIEDAEAEMAESRAVPSGPLRISMPLTGTLLTPVISGFMRAFPHIELDIDPTDRLVDIVEEGFDAVLRTGAAADSQLMTRQLGGYRYVIVAAPAYLARAGTPAEPEDLLRHACLHHRRTGSGKVRSWRLARGGAPIDLDLPRTVVSSTIEPLVGMAEHGVGITQVPAFAVGRELDEGRLVTILDGSVEDESSFRMLWPAGRQRLPRVRAFIDFMGEHFPTTLDVARPDEASIEDATVSGLRSTG